jgi:hypothetical protein
MASAVRRAEGLITSSNLKKSLSARALLPSPRADLG